MKFKSHKIPKIDKTICNAEQKIAYNYLFAYYTHGKIEALDLIQRLLAIKAEEPNYKYDIDLIYHYVLQSIDRYINNNTHIFGSYEDIGKVIYSDHFIEA